MKCILIRRAGYEEDDGGPAFRQPGKKSEQDAGIRGREQLERG